ncbi:MAG: ATP-binding cassette domain-containing protein, partial [Nonomuraea sp.]|nr:ATP-binding cassette domain-containing protein [Nonomuraea sp.]
MTAPDTAPAAAPAAPGGREPRLEIRGLTVDYGEGADAVHAVDRVDLTLHRSETLGLAGESGSGKSTLAHAVTRLLRPPGTITGGTVVYHRRAKDGGTA